MTRDAKFEAFKIIADALRELYYSGEMLHPKTSPYTGHQARTVLCNVHTAITFYDDLKRQQKEMIHDS